MPLTAWGEAREPAEPWPVRSVKEIKNGLLIETVWGAGTEAEPMRIVKQVWFTCEGMVYLVRLGDDNANGSPQTRPAID